MKTYTFQFSPPCSPEEFRQYLEQRVQEENEAAGKALKIILKWRKDGQFDLRANFYSRIEGSGANIEGSAFLEKNWAGAGISFSAKAEVGIEAAFSEIFRGRVELDKEGGCTVCGRFHHHPWVYRIILAFAPLPLLKGLMEGADMLSPNIYWLWALACSFVGLYPYFAFYRYCDGTSCSQWIIGFLENCSIRWRETLGKISE